MSIIPSFALVNGAKETISATLYHLYKLPGDTDDTDAWVNSPYYSDGGYIPPWSYGENTNFQGPFEPVVFRTEDGEIAYCADFGKNAPTQELTQKDESVKDAISQVIKAGYPNKKGSDYGVSDAELEWATAVAIKIVDGNVYNSQTGEKIENATLTLDMFNNQTGPFVYTSNERAAEAENIKSVISDLISAATSDLINISNKENQITKEVTVPPSDMFVTYPIYDTLIGISDKLASSDGNLKIILQKKNSDAPDLIVFASYKNRNKDTVDLSPVQAGDKQTVTVPLKDASLIEFYLSLSVSSESPITSSFDEDYDLIFETENVDSGFCQPVLYANSDNLEQDVVVAYDGPFYFASQINIKASDVAPAKINLYKREKGTQEGLADATFEIKRSIEEDSPETATFFAEVTTDENGFAEINNLIAGTYYIKETVAPKGFSLPDYAHVVKVGVDGLIKTSLVYATDFSSEYTEDIDSDEYEIIIENKKLNMDFQKIDAETEGKISGAVFELKNDDVTLTAESDQNGIVSFNGLNVGDYELKELSAPAGYALSNNTYHVTLNSNGTYYVHEQVPSVTTSNNGVAIKNSKTKVTLIKTDDNGNPIQNVSINVFNDSGYSETFTTDSNGKITIEGLVPGNYNFKEVSCPPEYSKLDETFSFSLSKYGVVSGTTKITNSKNVVKLFKKDAETEKGLANAEIRVFSDDFDETYTTDENGEIEIVSIPAGQYSVQEITPPSGYKLDLETYEFVVSEYGTVSGTTTLLNEKTKAEIVKTDALTGDPLPGAEIRIYTASGEDMLVGTTDEFGKISLEGFPEGEYFYYETKAPSGYIKSDAINSFSVLFDGSITGEFSLENEPTSVTLSKYSLFNSRPLPGAELTVKDSNGTIVFQDKTNADGEVTINRLTPGEYSFTETLAPDGYVVSSETVYFAIDENGVVTGETEMSNSPNELVIHKTDSVSGLPLAGVTFTVYNDNGFSTNVTTDENGEAKLVLVPVGKLYIKEVSTITGYFLDSTIREIEMNSDGTVTGSTEFENEKTKVLIKKIDKETKEPIEGVTFAVYNKNNFVVATATTDADGVAEILGLPVGEYTFMEQNVPAGYIFSYEQHNFKIDSTSVSGTLTVENEKTSVLISKENTDGEELSGAVFDIFDESGNKVGTYTTDEGGSLEIKGLAPGKYSIVETSAPFGYALNYIEEDGERIPETYSFQLFESGRVSGTTKIVNKKIIATVIKTDTDGERLSGAEIEVLNEDLTPSNAIIEEEEDGIFAISNISPGKYIVKEISAPLGYVCSTDSYSFEVDEFGFMKNSVVIENEKTFVEITKTDSSTDKPLKGAKIDVFDSANQKVFSETTNNEGKIEIYGLLPGKYIYTETSAPAGYISTSEYFSFEIDSDGNVTGELDFSNDPIVVTLTKKDITNGMPLKGASIKVKSANGDVFFSGETDEKGKLTLERIPVSKYTFFEEKAPDGYVLEDSVLSFEVKEDGSVEGDTELFNAPIKKDTPDDTPTNPENPTTPNGNPYTPNENGGKPVEPGIYKQNDDAVGTGQQFPALIVSILGINLATIFAIVKVKKKNKEK